MTKMIHVDQLKPGMFVDRLDRSWLMTPFLCHRFLLRDEADIALLKQHGVCHVVIDPTKGRDVDEPLASRAEQNPAISDTTTLSAFSPPTSHASQQKETRRKLSREDLKIAQHVHAEAISAVQRILEGINGTVRPNGSALLAVAAQLQKFLCHHRTGIITALLLRQLREYDESLFSHVVDVCVFSLIVGIDQGLSPADLESLAVGAMLHDVGELRLPRNVFRTVGTSGDREHALKHQHPTIGFAMLSHADELSEQACRIVVEHHERIDGSGYPTGVRGSAISSLSQLVGLADAYVTLITSRGGRPALSPPQAIRQLYQLALRFQFDQTLVEHMIQSLGVYPIGSVVELNTGEHAIVIDMHSGVTVKPWVKLLSDANGRLLDEPFAVDLADPDFAVQPREIVRDLSGGMDRIDMARYLEH